MTDGEKLARDIETLLESIRLGCAELATKELSAQDRKGLIKNIKWCAHNLNLLLITIEHGQPNDA